MIVVLDNIRSMHNVGSIFRTSDGVGIEKIYLCGYTPSPIHDKLGHRRPQIEKVALGAVDFIEWEKSLSGWRCVDKLKKQGRKIIAIEQTKNSALISDYKLSKNDWDNSVLIVGNEIEGVSDVILKRADVILEIPMKGNKNSLNVSVAFGVAAYSLLY